MPSQQERIYPGTTLEKALLASSSSRHCRLEGEEAAAVAAETLAQAWDGVRMIDVDYEILPFVSDLREALKPGAPAIHANGNLSSRSGPWAHGEVPQGFQQALWQLTTAGE